MKKLSTIVHPLLAVSAFLLCKTLFAAMPALPLFNEPAPATPEAPIMPASLPADAALPAGLIPDMPLQNASPGALEVQSAPTAEPVSQAPTEQPPAPQVPSAMPPTEEKDTDKEDKKEIYLNFENTDLANFIEYIAEIKKLNVIPDKTLEGSKISLTIREPLSVEGAWNIFLTVLEMAGFSIVKVGDVHKIIPKDKKLTEPLPAYVNVPYTELPDSDLTIRYVTFLTNIQVGDIRPLLESMLSAPNVLIDQKDMNAFIITDKAYNIKSAVKLIQELDQMGLPESVTVLKLKRVNAVDVKTLLDALIRKPDTNPLARLLGKVAEGGTEYFSPTTRIIPEERTNSLILLGNTKSIDKIVDFITKNIDTEIKSAASPLHIYELQHIDAGQVKNILKEVTAIPDSATGQSAGKFGSIRGGVKYFRQIPLEVDKDGNRLIASCVDKQDWKLLKRTIRDLDKPQPQVAIESLLVTVSADDTKALGGMIRNKKHGQIGTNIDFQSANLTGAPSLEKQGDQNVSLLGDLLGQLVSARGQTALTFGKPGGGIWSVFSMLKEQTNASILSQPFITVANKTTANLTVGEIRRVIDSTVSGNATTNGFVDAEASTKLELTPQINLDGIIRLKVKVEITDFENTDGTNKSQKTLDTNITVADGQVLVLGGFVKTKVTEAKAKTPLLGDIPVLGWFFKKQTRTISKQYIFIFLAPTILKPRQAPGMQLYTKMKLHQATEDIEMAVETKRTMDPIHNWFFNPEKENYSHKVIDFANARYQPTTVDIRNDPYYHAPDEDAKRSKTQASAPEPESETPAKIVSAPLSAEQFLAKPATVTLASTPPAPLMPSTTPAPAIASPRSQPAPRTTVSDAELTQQRQQLKSLITPAAPPPPAPPPVQSYDVIEKRNDLKTFINPATPPEPLPIPTEIPMFDASKRNNLKEFLSAGNSLSEPVLPDKQHAQRAQA